MHRTLAALPAIALLAVAGCGSGSSSTTGSSVSSSSPTSSAAGTIHVASTSLGQVLVDGAGTHRLPAHRRQPRQVRADASCLMYWPAVGTPASGTSLPGVTAKVGQASTPRRCPHRHRGWLAAVHLRQGQGGR